MCLAGVFTVRRRVAFLVRSTTLIGWPPVKSSRVFYRYYVLVATCVFLRKHEWLRNACLAAALVVPSISALHGIVLTSYHVNGQFNTCPKTINVALKTELTFRL